MWIIPFLTLSFMLSGTIAPAHAADSSKPLIPGSTCISNGLLSAEVRNVTDGFDIGRYGFARGGCPVAENEGNPDLILFPIGTSYNTVRVWDTNTDYVEGSVSTSAPFSSVNLDSQSPVAQASSPTLISLGWTTSASSLNIAQDVEIQGSTVNDSRIRLTLSVHNGDTANHIVSMRDLLDLFIGDYDGTWIRFYVGTTPGSITGVESDFSQPYSFTAFEMSGCSSDPCTPGNFGTGTFSLFGSITSPPEATVPSRFVYGWWRAMKDSAFNYTSVQRQIGSTVQNVDGNQDSALLYFFGPTTLAPGQTTSATIFFSNQPTPILSPPAAGLAVSKFFTRGQAVNNLLPVDANGNPKVEVVLANGVVRSINPGEFRAWVNVTNTSPNPLESMRFTETLPMDWLVHPPFLPGQGAVHVLFVSSEHSSIRQLDRSSEVTVSVVNPETVTVTIRDFSKTAAGQPLMPGDSLLLSVKLDYGLTGTGQLAGSYPRDYTDTATVSGFTLPSFTGVESTATAQGLFVAYAKLVGSHN